MLLGMLQDPVKLPQRRDKYKEILLIFQIYILYCSADKVSAKNMVTYNLLHMRTKEKVIWIMKKSKSADVQNSPSTPGLYVIRKRCHAPKDWSTSGHRIP